MENNINKETAIATPGYLKEKGFVFIEDLLFGYDTWYKDRLVLNNVPMKSGKVHIGYKYEYISSRKKDSVLYEKAYLYPLTIAKVESLYFIIHNKEL